MQYIDQKEILDKTQGGRLVIELYYPGSSQCFDTPGKKFKAHDEKTPSATVKKMPDGVWIVTDFGGDQKPRNAIQVVMFEENCDFKQAINIIANKFNITPDGKQSEIFKATITKRDAEPEEEDGKWYFETKDFSMTEVLTIIAPKVWEYLVWKAEPRKADKNTEPADKLEVAMAEVIRIFRKYFFHSLKSYIVVKDRKATVIESTDQYPIFMFDLGKWKKIYQPKNVDAGKRFMHYGGRPADYIFGYDQALKAYNEIVKITADDGPLDDEDDEPKDKKQDKKPKKLQQLIITSGGSDGLNIACIGQCFQSLNPEQLAGQMHPVWMNSETAKLTTGQFKNFQGIAETVYNLPDIDKTGLRQAHELALEHLDVHTIYLPEELREKKDGLRNKACKDVRDYFRFYEVKDFFKLFKTAYPYRFWDVEPRHNKQGQFLKWGFAVNNKYMLNFLRRNGFYRYETESEKDLYFYIQITHNVVKRIEPRKIRDFINEFIEKRNPEVELMNTFLRSTQLNESMLSNLPFIKIDFNDFDKDTQWMFFQNRAVKITKDEVVDLRPADAEKYVWDDEVIKHRVKKLDDFFVITWNETAKAWDIEIKDNSCLVMRYLINASRIYWREELENRLDGIAEKDREAYAAQFNLHKDELKLMDGLVKKEDKEAYRLKHKFDIAGPLLTASEQAEQKLHLINKIFSLGYRLHRYKENSRAWALWAMDAKLSEGDESHGGSGKSLMDMLMFEHGLIKTIYREGRNPKLTDNPHIWEGVTEHTDIVFIDDCNKYIKFDFFFSSITGPIQVNPKNAKQYTVPYKHSPKFVFSSNYAPQNIDPSKERRLLYNVFSDYYHYNKMGEYREERRVFDDFGKNLGNDFTEEEWNLYLNFLMQCTRFYLGTEKKINPPMDNVNKRNLKAIMGDAFEPWADVYFSIESGRLNDFVVKSDALADFLKSTKQTWTTQKFSSALIAWCTYNDYVLNPEEHRNAQGRIIRSVHVKDDRGTDIKTTKEMVYIDTKAKEQIAAVVLAGQEPLPF